MSGLPVDAVGLIAVNPEALGRARGFAHGMLAPAGWRLLAVAGQTAADQDGNIPSADFVDQFRRALAKVIGVVAAAGGRPDQVTRMTVYVTDLGRYRASRPALAEVWRQHMGRHYPAMALVEVSGLVDAGASVEIQADAAVPPQGLR